jgi:hypothetical protein
MGGADGAGNVDNRDVLEEELELEAPFVVTLDVTVGGSKLIISVRKRYAFDFGSLFFIRKLSIASRKSFRVGGLW